MLSPADSLHIVSRFLALVLCERSTSGELQLELACSATTRAHASFLPFAPPRHRAQLRELIDAQDMEEVGAQVGVSSGHGPADDHSLRYVALVTFPVLETGGEERGDRGARELNNDR